MTRSYSLRLRVAGATALGAAIIVLTLGFFAAHAIEQNNLRQTDQKLEAVSQIVRFNSDLAVNVLTIFGPSGQFALTLRDNGSVTKSTPTELPDVGSGSHTVKVDGKPYRIYSTSTGPPTDKVIALGLPAAAAQEATQRQQREVAAAGGAAIAAAFGLGWLFGGRAVRPIVQLTHRIREHPPRSIATASGVREADELATALSGMLQRVDDAQAESTAALTTARDFAAASAHELRTPLTAMRTDIEVLRTLDLDEPQRAEILEDLQRAQGRVESTLSALERLASGELASDRDHVETDVLELCDLSAQDAMRHNPGLTVRVESDADLVVRGFPAGLRLALDNALSNAVRHGGAHNAVVSAHRRQSGIVVIAIDDDGAGLPADERTAVFERFYRGSTSSNAGSGLGLALVAQQAQLHGGRAYFEDSKLGGARLVIELGASRST